jgi:hypothetical protein
MKASGVLQPFLDKVGIGKFNLHFCSSAGAATVLLNSPELDSVPASRIIDMERFIDGLLPLIVPARKGGKLPSPSLVGLISTAKQSLKDSVREPKVGTKIPNMISLALSSSHMESVQRLMANSQVLLVHSEFDLSSLDIEQALAPGELSQLLSKVLQTL